MVGDDDNDDHDVHSFDVRLIVTVIGPAQFILRDPLSTCCTHGAPRLQVGAHLHADSLGIGVPIEL